MKGNKKTYRTIEEIVDGVCLDLGEGGHRKEQYFRYAIAEAERWKMDMAREVKSVQLSLTPWKSIELPSDCIDWIQIGVQDGDVIKTFVHKNDIATTFETNSNGTNIENPEPTSIKELNLDNTGLAYPFYNYYNTWENPGKLFGLSVKDNGFGYFAENRNEDSTEIQFRSSAIDSTAKIYLMYLADGWNPTTQTLIHPYAVELITLGIHYRRLKFDPTVSRALSQEAKRDYQEEYNRVIDRMWDYTTEDIIEAMSAGYMLAPNP